MSSLRRKAWRGSPARSDLISEPLLTWTVCATGLNIATGVVETFWEREEPDILGPDLISRGQDVIIHISCKDWNTRWFPSIAKARRK